MPSGVTDVFKMDRSEGKCSHCCCVTNDYSLYYVVFMDREKYEVL